MVIEFSEYVEKFLQKENISVACYENVLYISVNDNRNVYPKIAKLLHLILDDEPDVVFTSMSIGGNEAVIIFDSITGIAGFIVDCIEEERIHIDWGFWKKCIKNAKSNVNGG